VNYPTILLFFYFFYDHHNGHISLRSHSSLSIMSGFFSGSKWGSGSKIITLGGSGARTLNTRHVCCLARGELDPRLSLVFLSSFCHWWSLGFCHFRLWLALLGTLILNTYRPALPALWKLNWAENHCFLQSCLMIALLMLIAHSSYGPIEAVFIKIG